MRIYPCKNHRTTQALEGYFGSSLVSTKGNRVKIFPVKSYLVYLDIILSKCNKTKPRKSFTDYDRADVLKASLDLPTLLMKGGHLKF